MASAFIAIMDPDERPREEDLQECLRLAHNSQSDELQRFISFTHIIQGIDLVDYVTCIEDPSSGNSLLHIAARNELLDFLNYIVCYSDRGNRYGTRTVWHDLLNKRNNVGDTPLHSAAKAGRLLGVQAIYAMVSRRYIQDPARADWNPFHDPFQEHGLSGEWREVRQEYLNLKNNAGNTTLSEAKIYGHTHIVKWIKKIIAVQGVGPNDGEFWEMDRLRPRVHINKPQRYQG